MKQFVTSSDKLVISSVGFVGVSPMHHDFIELLLLIHALGFFRSSSESAPRKIKIGILSKTAIPRTTASRHKVRL